MPGLPFDPYRGVLYSPGALYEGLTSGGYGATPDARAYHWFRRTKADGDAFASMLRALHDDAVSDALDEFLTGARVVGVTGGHATARGSGAYAAAARLGRTLARSTAGVIFLPGAAGTVQEIFDNATTNYYESHAAPTSMVLVGRAHWTDRLRAPAAGGAMESRIALVDTVEEAPQALARLTNRKSGPSGR